MQKPKINKIYAKKKNQKKSSSNTVVTEDPKMPSAISVKTNLLGKFQSKAFELVKANKVKNMINSIKTERESSLNLIIDNMP